jgi:hypothetical protein
MLMLMLDTTLVTGREKLWHQRQYWHLLGLIGDGMLVIWDVIAQMLLALQAARISADSVLAGRQVMEAI